MSLGEREDELYQMFQVLVDEGLPHVCVGGLAVSAFLPRLTLDIDLVVPSDAQDAYRDVFDRCGYEFAKEYETDGMYGGRMVQYEKDVGGHSVAVELLIDALVCRQTTAEWSYEYLTEHSQFETIRGTEPGNEIHTRIAEPELLVAVKLHSGRPQDARDAVAVAAEADLDRVQSHLTRGDTEALRDSLGRVLDELERDQFDDSFKGDFQLTTIPEARIDAVIEFLTTTRNSL